LCRYFLRQAAKKCQPIFYYNIFSVTLPLERIVTLRETVRTMQSVANLKISLILYQLMKAKFLAITLGALMAACTSATATNDSYTVTASLPDDFNGKTAFLVNYDNGEKIDSTTVTNGTALFKGNIAEAIAARLLVDGNRCGTFFVEPGEITFKDRVASGSQLNDLDNTMQKELKQRVDAKLAGVPDDQITDSLRNEVNALYEAYIDSTMVANINNPLGYILFLEKGYEMTAQELKAALAKYPSLKKYKRVADLVKAAEVRAATAPGAKFTDFTIENENGTQSLSDYVGKGKPVLVDFWASWCGPCVKETRVLKSLLEEYGSKGLEVLGVAVWDEPENTKEAIARLKLPWNQIINAQTIPTELYGITGIPCILLVAPDGTILSRGKQDEELRADVAAYFDGTLTSASFAAEENATPEAK
jgi:thiol-disulfide isomerase/thioredoxin